ncbi:MAG: Mur ligase family protein, partial [Bacteroidota bacterium]
MKKKIVILGAGESGTGSAILAKKQNMEVFVSDIGPIKEKYKTLLEKHQLQYEENTHTTKEILEADEIIKSPGIPDTANVIHESKKAGIPVISEIEFAGRYTEAFNICITGSNGKTTTTNLTYHILKTAGLNVGVSGNVGESFARQVAENNFDYHVIELSSFQLDGIYQFKPEIAIILNITPDHLDRYDNSIENYTNSKFRITKNLTSKDLFI